MANQRVPSTLKEVEFSHNTLRLHLAHLERQGTQEGQKQMHTSKLPPNPKTRIITILRQFRDKAARVRSDNVGRMTIGSQSGACRCVSWCQCKPWIRRQNAEAQEDGVDLICFWLKNTKPFYARSPYDVASH